MNLKVTDWQHAVVLYLNKCSRFKFLIFLKDIFRCSLVLNQITYRSKTSWNVARWNNHHISPNHATTASQCHHQLENRFANLSNIIRSWVRHPEALLLIERVYCHWRNSKRSVQRKRPSPLPSISSYSWKCIIRRFRTPKLQPEIDLYKTELDEFHSEKLQTASVMELWNESKQNW